jgi:hypothetical protein
VSCGDIWLGSLVVGSDIKKSRRCVAFASETHDYLRSRCVHNNKEQARAVCISGASANGSVQDNHSSFRFSPSSGCHSLKVFGAFSSHG